uniref:CYTH domain-containing protein n=1 Tax=Ciona savignyi TaxID=51511 RepID=H2Y8G1_CIOSA
MPKNVEIKAKIENFDNFIKTAISVSEDNGSVLEQEDFFYNCNTGRLKLRSCKENGEPRNELIFYTRPDAHGPKMSDFVTSAVPDPESMDRILRHTLGRKGVVTKQRRLFLIGQTRIHVDRVKGLGDFMELEVMLRDDQSPEDGARVAQDLMSKLGVKECDLVTGAYMDLIIAGNKEQSIRG